MDKPETTKFDETYANLMWSFLRQDIERHEMNRLHPVEKAMICLLFFLLVVGCPLSIAFVVYAGVMK